MRVLLVEDDPVLGSAIRDHVASLGHAVDRAHHLAEADELMSVASYEMILLDLRLPDGNGLDLLRKLRRADNPAAIIILTARDRLSERIDGLNAGADDYLVKPFELDELSARITAVARRYSGRTSPVIRTGSAEIDLARRVVMQMNREVFLSSREWIVLEELARKPGATVSKRHLEDAIYAFGMEVESNTIEVYLSRIRKKVGRDTIKTIRGVGYKLVVQ
ncbi:MAG: response regulator [Rhizobiaceae bacterium]|nr:response regulator [Rhizobiaceae bacterium]